MVGFVNEIREIKNQKFNENKNKDYLTTVGKAGN